MVRCKRPRLTTVKSVRHGSQPHGSIGQWPIVKRCSKSIVTFMWYKAFKLAVKNSMRGRCLRRPRVSRRGLTHVLNMETLDVELRHGAAPHRLALGEATKDRRKRHCMYA